MGRNTQTVLKQQQLILMGQDKRWAQFRVKPFSFPSNRLTGKTMVNGEKKKKKKKKREENCLLILSVSVVGAGACLEVSCL